MEKAAVLLLSLFNFFLRFNKKPSCEKAALQKKRTHHRSPNAIKGKFTLVDVNVNITLLHAVFTAANANS